MSNTEIKEIIAETVKEVINSQDNKYNIFASDISQIKKDIQELKIKEVTHALNCPQDKRIKTIEDNLFEYNIIKKYPKLVASIFLMVVVLSVISYFKSL